MEETAHERAVRIFKEESSRIAKARATLKTETRAAEKRLAAELEAVTDAFLLSVEQAETEKES